MKQGKSCLAALRGTKHVIRSSWPPLYCKALARFLAAAVLDATDNKTTNRILGMRCQVAICNARSLRTVAW